MKLKERLAQDYANNESTCPVNDFIAGFEKAREMILDAQNEEYKSGSETGMCLNDIGMIGEEEV